MAIQMWKIKTRKNVRVTIICGNTPCIYLTAPACFCYQLPKSALYTHKYILYSVGLHKCTGCHHIQKDPKSKCIKYDVTHHIIAMPDSSNGLFTLPDPDSDSDSDSDSKPYGYIVLFRTFHIGSDPDPDPFPLVFV